MNLLNQIFYPNLCRSCDKKPPVPGRLFCAYCLFHLPYASFDSPGNNEFIRHFWGRVLIKYGISLFYYVQNGPVPEMIKSIKYKGAGNLGKDLGRELGIQIKACAFISEIDLIVPVPIHPKKKRIRGYNQAQMIAEGLSKELKIPVGENVLERSNFNESQTRKTRNDRVKDLRESFVLGKKDISNKHILLVDDVLTTGATLEACSTELLKQEGVKVSLATLAQGLLN